MEDYNDLDMSTPILNLNNMNKRRNIDHDVSNIVKDLENKHSNVQEGELMAFNENDRDSNNRQNYNHNESNHTENNMHNNLKEIQETQQLRYNPNYIPDSEEYVEPFENETDIAIDKKEPENNNIYKTIYDVLIFLKYPFIFIIKHK